MKFEDSMAHLNRKERKLFGCDADVPVDDVPCASVIDARLNEYDQAMRLSTIAIDGLSGCMAAAALWQAKRHLRIAGDVAGPILVHQIEISLDNTSHESAEDPFDL